MNSWKGLLACAVIAGIIVALLLRSDANHHAPVGLIGNPAPDFGGDFAINGDPVKLSELRGKVVMLDFWATWCGPCIAAIPHLVELNAKYKSAGLALIGVSAYNPNQPIDQQRERLTKFAQQYHMDYLVMTLGTRTADQIMDSYGVHAIPYVVLIDRKGVVRHAVLGNEPDYLSKIEQIVKELLAER
jgi:cytochrome c biogenesis protein CcmG, thiol:disulfide interchange protein DsbE